MSTEPTTLSTTERVVSALTAALPMAGEATFTASAGRPSGGQAFIYRAPGWSGAVTVVVDPSAPLPEMVSSDPSAALTPAVDSALSTVGASGPSTVERAADLGAGESVYLIAVGGAPSLWVSVHEGQPLPAVQRGTTAGVDEDFLRNVHRIRGVDMELSVVIGRTTLTVAELMRIKPGQVIELDRAAGAPADILVNGRHMASGEVVVQDLDFAVKITSIRDENAENA